MGNAVCNHLDRYPFGVANRLIARLAVTKDTGLFDGFGNPATVVLTLQLNR